MLVVTLLEVSEKEEGIVAFHLPIGPLKTCSSPLADDLATALFNVETAGCYNA